MRKGNLRRPISSTNPLMESLPVIVSGKGFCYLANLIQDLGAMELQTLLIEGTMVAFDKAILLGMMGCSFSSTLPDQLTSCNTTLFIP